MQKKFLFETKSIVDFARLCCFETFPLLVFSIKKNEKYKLICNFKGLRFFTFSKKVSKFIEYNANEEEKIEFVEKPSLKNPFSPIVFLEEEPNAKKEKIKFFKVKDFDSISRIALHELNKEVQSAIFIDSKAWTIVEEDEQILIFYSNSFPKLSNYYFTDGENFSKTPKLGFVKIIFLKDFPL
ncbi:MAG: hypothetical protein ACPLXS_01235 [Candidatus Micrarchaeales archaeon]